MSPEKELTMVLCSRRIRIQRVKIHMSMNSRVLTPVQYTFILWACVIVALNIKFS